ncbi:cyclic nucleotide-gated channel rod photoreceptor subunit alpha-like [Ylistrum balloti]|uniref:cyclic nucleotide-gated channel rod photoreceptor subunit alpha-like n=1 Tax=Ylistrum balloti TaxID=509963 RepID=UPI002905C71B|nr:cyclic nucleotide-gated channel rod photoreceptor subunit alpha-like [Ylistrum balloti]
MIERLRRKSSSAERSVSDARKKWGKAISTVRRGSAAARRESTAVTDPFLERFTVTGRASLDEFVEHYFTDIFTAQFWKELVINPANPSYYYLSLLVTCAILYNLIFVILRGTFYETNNASMMKIWMPLDYFCDSLYILDMFFMSRIGYLEQGLLVRKVDSLSKRYLLSFLFIIDLLAILPLEFLYFVVGYNAMLRLNRVLKLWRMRDFFRLAETHTNSPNMFRVANLILMILVIIHWNACGYFALSRFFGFGTDEWVYPDPNTGDHDQFIKQYVYSFYWSVLTLTTIGDTPVPERTASYMYCIGCSLAGVLIFATIFGNVGAMINEMNAQRTNFQHKVDAVKRYMEIRKVGGELQERVVKWFDYTWNNKQSVDDRQALEFLPEKLRAEISIHVHLDTLRRVAIFKDCEPGLLVELVLKLRLQVFSPGDYICRKGDIGKEMYIVKRGKLQVVSEDGKTVFVTLSDGAVFGEVSILNLAGNKTGNRRTAGVRSMGYSDLFCLSKNDLWEALQEYPEAKQLLSERGKQILRKDNLLDEEAARREERRRQNLDKKIELIADSLDDLKNDVNALMDRINKKARDKAKTEEMVIEMLKVKESGSSQKQETKPPSAKDTETRPSVEKKESKPSSAGKKEIKLSSAGKNESKPSSAEKKESKPSLAEKKETIASDKKD